MELSQRKCVPCEGGVPALGAGQVVTLISQLPGWRVAPGESELHKRYNFKNFVETMAFVNRIAELAEGEGHHPDFCVRYNVLDVALSTHAVSGLTENDFILAAKIDQLG
jgi:4a-hydroxytetrahydrobiopterin dehydratase